MALSALKSWLNAAAMGKFYALPPDTPAAYAAAYRDAFTRMQADPEFQEKAKVALDPDYEMMSAADTKALVAAVMATSDADRDFLAQMRLKTRPVARGRSMEASRSRSITERPCETLAAVAKFIPRCRGFCDMNGQPMQLKIAIERYDRHFPFFDNTVMPPAECRISSLASRPKRDASRRHGIDTSECWTTRNSISANSRCHRS